MPNAKRKRIELLFDELAASQRQKGTDIRTFSLVSDSFDLRMASVLDVGCSVGDKLIYCWKRGAQYLEGIDISGRNIEIAKQRTKGCGNIYLQQKSIEEYDTNREFDLVIAWGVFEYFDRPYESLVKIARTVRRNGRLVMLVSNPIFVKRISFIFRWILSRTEPSRALTRATSLAKLAAKFEPILNHFLTAGKSKTYTLEQTIVEGLMVPRYNILNLQRVLWYLSCEGFRTELVKDISASMKCIVARKRSGVL